MDPEPLAEAVRTTVAGTETLCVRFAEVDGVVRRIPAGPPPLRMETADVSGHPDPDAESDRLMRAEPARPTDLATGDVCRHGTRWSALVMAAAAAHLHRAGATEDVVLGLPVTGRTTPDARRTPGMFSKVLPLRLTVAADTTVAELLRGTSAGIKEALRLFPVWRELDARGPAGPADAPVGREQGPPAAVGAGILTE
ncbi:hypothetical protein Snoj_15050 [Streptomyces nojiriensis]|uniref:Condensation domain-containing protein n=1 Tax=Streptomyces nojiriensis TaxID=66374 RepID=A0ABQ3SHG2_9ACTN|nr:condensation domain-containing protein [Streptomyces nojiriensis]QTI49212.1 Dimodular nonribosomal peptide synthase [Streptomyces nojiriensis]GGS10546.1 hypothetical protein GCM10010205_44980 [Streptomyces nojiriensis]GHI67587.1 hypothetical protein Snoj_15050 [Streptomyces nojiriensis]